MGVIPNSIPDQAFEIVRDRIGAIIADELQQQSAINYDDDLTAPVWMERITPFNYSETTHGAINIQLEGSNYDGETQATQYGTTNFSIYFYFSAKSSTEGIADKRAKYKLARLMGVVRGILMDSRYNRLGFDGAFITNRRVVDMAFGDPINSQDGSSVTVGRINFAVRVNENVALSSVRVLDGYGTQVTLSETDLGYVYGISDFPAPSPACAPVSIKVNSTSLADINSGVTFNVTIVDTDGVNQGVVSELTSYGVKVTVPVGGALDIQVNGTLFLEDQTGLVAINVWDSDDNPTGFDDGGIWRIENSTVNINSTQVAQIQPSSILDLGVKDSAGNNTGTVGNPNTVVADSIVTLGTQSPADPLTPIRSQQNKTINLVDAIDLDPVQVIVATDTETLADLIVPNTTGGNSDSSYTFIKKAGGNQLLPDINLTQPNGDIEVHPSVKDISCDAINALVNADLISQLTDDQVKAVYDGRININVIEYTTVGTTTYTKPANLLFAHVICIGGGGGGASGARRAGPTASQGGGGGGAGAIARRILEDSEISGAGITVTVGNGGTGGASQTVDSSAQLGGSTGGSSSFGSLVVAIGGNGAANGSNAAGAITITSTNTPQGSQLNIQGGAGGAGGTTGAGTTATVMGTSSPLLHYGGGGGGALSAATPGVEAAGGPGSRIYDSNFTLSAVKAGGLAGGGNGNAGNDNIAKQFQIWKTILHNIGLGSSGSGGGSENAAAAGNGGTGGLYGAGGGGGGGSRNGFASGAGGNGAQGAVVIYEFLV